MPTLLLGFNPDALTAEQLDRVRATAVDYDVVCSRDRAEIEQLLPTLEIAAGGMPRDLMREAPQLRWFQQWGAGADWLLREPDPKALRFQITTASGVHAIPISEHIIGVLLAIARRFPQAIRAQDRKEWVSRHRPHVFELAGKHLLMVGVGAIGARAAHIAHAMDIRVTGVRRRPEFPADGISAMHGFADLPELLPTADLVVATLPLTPATRHVFGETAFRAMKPEAVFVNIGRGGLVDEGALVQALREGWIAAAALDVFETEPLPSDSPLWLMEQVLLTAHYSGSTPHYTERALSLFLDNLTRYQSGQPLRNLVDREQGY